MTDHALGDRQWHVMIVQGEPEFPLLQRAFGAVQLEGPAETVRTAGRLLECLRAGAGHSPDDQERVRQEFIDAARAALASAELPPA